jgi:hypothetical protein
MWARHFCAIIAPSDNMIRPEELPPLARAELREAFNAIGRAQQQLNRFIPLGT